jgi:hypothetical protein
MGEPGVGVYERCLEMKLLLLVRGRKPYMVEERILHRLEALPEIADKVRKHITADFPNTFEGGLTVRDVAEPVREKLFVWCKVGSTVVDEVVIACIRPTHIIEGREHL